MIKFSPLWLIAPIVALLLSGALRAEPIVLTDSDGGNIYAHAADWRRYEASGQEVQLRGYCVSACTMFLSLENVCVGPRARFGFHATRGDIFGTYRRFLTPPLRAWFDANARRSRVWVWLSVAELQAIQPGVRVCRNRG